MRSVDQAFCKSLYLLFYEGRIFHFIFRQSNVTNYSYQPANETREYNYNSVQDEQRMRPVPPPTQGQSSTATRELDDLMSSLSGFKVGIFTIMKILIFEPLREKTNNLGFRPGPTQTGLYCHRRMLEA